MQNNLNLDEIDEGKIINVGNEPDYIDIKITLEPGSHDYRAINPVDAFPVFSVVFDPWSGPPKGAEDGAAVVWENRLMCVKGRWYHVFRIENQSTVAATVIVRTKSL